MSKRLEDIKRRQEMLVARAAEQRGEIGRIAATWRPSLRFIDEVIYTVRTLRLHPSVVVVARSLLMTVAPRHRRLLLWGGRAFIGWEAYRAVRSLWSSYHSAAEAKLEREVEHVD